MSQYLPGFSLQHFLRQFCCGFVFFLPFYLYMPGEYGSHFPLLQQEGSCEHLICLGLLFLVLGNIIYHVEKNLYSYPLQILWEYLHRSPCPALSMRERTIAMWQAAALPPADSQRACLEKLGTWADFIHCAQSCALAWLAGSALCRWMSEAPLQHEAWFWPACWAAAGLLVLEALTDWHRYRFVFRLFPQESSPSPTAPQAVEKPQRIASIDALRGFDMLLLCGGAALLSGALDLAFGGSMPEAWAAQFRHANWGEGFTCWDLVMPLFIFIVGASMPFAFARYREKGGERWRYSTSWRVLKRVALLFVLGMLVQGGLASANPQHMSLFCNTLQAIAAGYLLATPWLMWGGWRSQGAACLLYLLLYWALLRFVPYGGHEGGRFLPGDNLAIYVDCALQGDWQDGTPYSWILTSLAFGGLTLMGVLGGQVLRHGFGWRSVGGLSLAGLLCLGAALLLEQDTPLIKHIFTSTMVLWSGGFCLLLLALFHLLFDLVGGRLLRALALPLQVFGCNALLAYVFTQCPGMGGHSLWEGVSWPLLGGLAHALSPTHAALVFALLSFILLGLMLGWLYRHRAFLRV